jgi:hypothetical protein
VSSACPPFARGKDDAPTADDVRVALEHYREHIETMPGVLGSGVGLSGDGDPVIHVFVSADSGPELIKELERIMPGYFEVISQEGPADA